ncbi:MAG: DUF1592 domain-containing protein [Myxococcales bacterium]|nr:DUF1592 domain-containing protein [Myxococcales bacterium]
MHTLRRLIALTALAVGLGGCAGTLTVPASDGDGGPTGPAPAALAPTQDGGSFPDAADAQDGGASPARDAAPANDDAALPEPEDPFEPISPRLQRLTVGQYRNSLRDLLGVEVAAELEADTPLHGFAVIGGGELTIGPRAAEQYEAAATEAVAAAFADPAGRTGCAQPEPGCLAEFFRAFGRRAWRRPLDEDEVAALVTLSQGLGEQLRDPWGGVAGAASLVLQAPDFLFRVEVGQDGPDGRQLTGFELAGRLAAFLWQSAPDDALLDAAAEGLLDTAEGLRAEAERMLADARAERGVLGFFAEAFTLDQLPGLVKDREAFVRMTPTLGAAMQGEIQALLRWLVIDEDADLRALLTTRTVFVNAELAALYGLPPVEGPGFTAVQLPPRHPRGGLLGTAGFLAVNAHASVTSPTHRGKAIQNQLLCFDVPPPPPGVATNLDGVGGDAPTTTREKLARHAADPTCAGCHQFMDPLGLALENFDALGAWRTTENGHPIDARGEFRGEPFVGGRALAERVAATDDFAACQVRRLYRYALGHLEAYSELPAIDELALAFQADGRRFRGLVLALVSHPAFRAVGPLDEEAP